MEKENKGFFKKLFHGLSKTRTSISQAFDSVLSGSTKIDDDFYEELEEVLILSDIGVETTGELIDELKAAVKQDRIREPEQCREILIEKIKELMTAEEEDYSFEDGPSIIMVVGVNGVGKTTSIGKLAHNYKENGRKVLMAAADTFRAAAGAQLLTWAERAGVEIIGGQDGADPSSIVFDAVASAKAKKYDILLCDTAGRLHNKKNLMEELKKMHRIIAKGYPEAGVHTFVVLDATTGQNALMQAKLFADAADVDGIILTKMDGTAKGGIAVAIQSQLGIPVKYIGVGEGIDDLQHFNAEQYVNAIFGMEEETEA